MSVDRDPNLTRRGGSGKGIVTFADVARRTTSRTTDLIAIAIVGVGSLTLGRQVLEWWHADPPLASSTAASSATQVWEPGGGPLLLEFGDSPLAITREAVRGDRETAIDALLARCQDEARSCDTSGSEPAVAEMRLLERIADLTPAVDEDGLRQVYVVDERYPMVAAVGRPRGANVSVAPAESAPHTTRRDDKILAEAGPRLLCWGLAMPLGESAWTLYVFRGSSAKNGAAPAGLDVPLPPGARRNLSLRDARGGTLVGFSAAGRAETLMTFYDDWFRQQGWLPGEGWHGGNRVWTARYRSDAKSMTHEVDVRFAEDSGGLLSGLLQTTPRDVNAKQRGRE